MLIDLELAASTLGYQRIEWIEWKRAEDGTSGYVGFDQRNNLTYRNDGHVLQGCDYVLAERLGYERVDLFEWETVTGGASGYFGFGHRNNPAFRSDGATIAEWIADSDEELAAMLQPCEGCDSPAGAGAVRINDVVLCEDCASSAVNCQACGEQVFTYPFVADATGGEEAVLLAGDIVLCEDCYLEALAARRKIVVSEDEEGIYEDRSALTAEERKWAELLDIAEEAANRADREMISSYPRREQRQLHRYQDDIEAERFRSGKST